MNDQTKIDDLTKALADPSNPIHDRIYQAAYKAFRELQSKQQRLKSVLIDGLSFGPRYVPHELRGHRAEIEELHARIDQIAVEATYYQNQEEEHVN